MSSGSARTQLRWQHYVLVRDDRDRGDERFRAFWTDHLGQAERSVLYILGRGFDPRMCQGLKLLMEIGGKGPRDVIALEFREGTASPSLIHEDLVQLNWIELQALIAGRGTLTTQPLEFWSAEGRRVSSQSARDLFASVSSFDGYTDIVVDISAMPRSVYFPLLARILYLLDTDASARKPVTNLHAVVAEDPAFDAQICVEGVDERAEFMASFSGGFDEESIQIPKVWIPLLGELRTKQVDASQPDTIQFARIMDLVKPDEVCPVLPFPARNPRRADDIVVEYQRILFDELHLDPREFLYASEQNPFQVYRQMRNAVLHYNDVFRLLGGCKVALSALCSKLMSLGALLVAYELKRARYNIGVAHIECQGYTLESQAPNAELVGLWLAGECNAP